MAKWIFDPIADKPVRVSDEVAAEKAKKGARYLSKNEAKRMLAAAEAKQ